MPVKLHVLGACVSFLLQDSRSSRGKFKGKLQKSLVPNETSVSNEAIRARRASIDPHDHNDDGPVPNRIEFRVQSSLIS
jgi:hypothetical protein